MNRLLLALFKRAGVPVMSAPLLSVSPQSAIGTQINANSRGSGTYTTWYNRIPFVIGSSTVDSIKLLFNAWYIQSSVGVASIGNGYTIEKCAVEGNSTHAPVTFSGARSKVINALDSEIPSDDFTAALLSLGDLPVGSLAYIRIAIKTLRGEFIHSTPLPVTSGINTVNFDPDKVLFSNDIDGTGDFAYSMINGGVNGVDAVFTQRQFPVVIVANHSGVSVGFLGDSKTAGTGDTATATTFTGGLARSLFPSVGSRAGAKAGILFGCPSGTAVEHTAGANAALIQGYYKYCTHAVVGYGTNSRNEAAQTALHTALRAQGIAKIIQMSLTPRTTGTYTSAGGQTAVAGWNSSGGTAGTFETFLQAKLATDADMTYYNPSFIRDSFDGGDYWKWRSNGGVARTADGLHENAVGYEENVGTAGEATTLAGGTVSTNLRALVQALFV